MQYAASLAQNSTKAPAVKLASSMVQNETKAPAVPLANRESKEAELAIQEQKALEAQFTKGMPAAKIPQPDPESAEE